MFQLLSVCHIVAGHQVYVHPCQLVVVVLLLAVCVTFTSIIAELWAQEWTVVYLSLQVHRLINHPS